MTITTFTSRDLNQDVSRAKRAARQGPVVITDRGKPSHVLLTYAEYERLSGRHQSLLDALTMTGLSEIEFIPERTQIGIRQVDLD